MARVVWSFGVRCVMLVVCGSLFVIRCLCVRVFVDCCSSFVVCVCVVCGVLDAYVVLFAVRCVLFVVCCVLCVMCRVQCAVCVVCCLMCVVCC